MKGNVFSCACFCQNWWCWWTAITDGARASRQLLPPLASYGAALLPMWGISLFSSCPPSCSLLCSSEAKDSLRFGISWLIAEAWLCIKTIYQKPSCVIQRWEAMDVLYGDCLCVLCQRQLAFCLNTDCRIHLHERKISVSHSKPEESRLAFQSYFSPHLLQWPMVAHFIPQLSKWLVILVPHSLIFRHAQLKFPA